MTDIDHLIREDLPPDIKEKLKFLGKLVPDPRFNAATLSDKKVEVLMDLIKASFDESYGNLIDQIVTITNISRSTLYNYRNDYLEDEKFNPKTAQLLVNRAIDDEGELLIANYIITEFIEKKFFFQYTNVPSNCGNV
ncbi:hypothetical protein TVAG_284460 [Trichomonas vaginalis G3]|uniref:Uncharacterized protein n=1 Tax=Trichomonas vaginalis (strain ATCC PRA-98 / G3) TaxID=412133 RepID=A2ENA4_TRIV3|nr:hypothetical protein TVAG_284460 [Trichomonas vaginalis G3]|eukprot:XP_001318086.1 hypothetical protein [Trichomonas vaginalis G3]